VIALAFIGLMANPPPIAGGRVGDRSFRASGEQMGAQILPMALEQGDHVLVRDVPGRVVSVRTCGVHRLVTIRGHRAEAAAVRVLTPFDRFYAIRRPRVHRAPPSRWLSALGHALAGEGALRTAANARLDPLAFQFEPVLALLEGHTTRLLLADDVGLGKTIQAALAVAELSARGLADRVLVASPAGLRSQWQEELARFGLPATVVDAAAIRHEVESLPAWVNPWALDGVRIVSMDFVKRREVRKAVESLAWDVMVLDEAHHAAPGSDRGEALRAIARRSRVVILLTATPHGGDQRDFEYLCAIGQVEGGPGELTVFRRTRRDLGMPLRRRVRVLAVRAGDAENAVFAELRRYGAAILRTQPRGTAAAAARLAMILLEKRALSSAAALERSLRHRLALIGVGPAVVDPVQTGLPFGDPPDEGADDDDGLPGFLGAPGLLDVRAEGAWLSRLIAMAEQVAWREGKAGAIERLLRRTNEPVILFTEYRDTLKSLSRRLEGSAVVVVLHGGMTAAERRQAIARFLAGEARVLVATDAAGEGLNLHRTCRLVVNVEVPWTPTRLEQRIGRVDRLGQERVVHAITLSGRGARETFVIDRLRARLSRLRSAMGSAFDGLGLAFGPIGLASLPPAPSPAVDLGNAAAAEAERVRAARRWIRSTPDAPGSCWCQAGSHLRRALACRHALAISETPILSANGSCISTVRALVSLDGAAFRRATTRASRVMAAMAAATAVAEHRAAAASNVSAAAGQQLARRLLERERTLLGSLGPGDHGGQAALKACLDDRVEAKAPVEPRLFDRRVDRELETAAWRDRTMRSEHVRRIARLKDMVGPCHPGQTQVVALLLAD
jgi:superfamily II DNA or RNA helicase